MQDTIRSFLAQKAIAVAGASDKTDNFGGMLVTELSRSGYDVYPVNPNYDTVKGIPSVPGVQQLPPDVNSLILAVPPEITLEIVQQSVGSGIRRIWMHKGAGRGAFSGEAYELCCANGIDIVYGFCPMMFFGKGVHGLHGWFRRTFGKVPREFKD